MNDTKKRIAFLEAKNLALEKQLQKSKEFENIKRLNESQEISQIGSWSWDVVNRDVYWSDQMYKIIGLLPNQETPSYELALKYVHPDFKEEYEAALGVAMKNKADYYLENKMLTEAGQILQVISRGVCVVNEKKELIQMMGTVQDITLFKELKESNKQLEQFAHILSHDFKTPIRSIISFISLIKKKSFDALTEEGKEYFDFIQNSAHHLSGLVNDILEYSKLNSSALNKSEIKVKGLVEKILLRLEETLKSKEGKITIGKLPETIWADSIKIDQVFQNLISNAIKYTAPDVKPNIEISSDENDTEFLFYVRDNGIGIEEKYMKKIFDPYVRIDTGLTFSGTGIGLSICKRVIELHHGKIGFLANSSSGSKFYFSIPKTK